MNKWMHKLLAFTLSTALLNAYAVPAYAAHQIIDQDTTVSGQTYQALSDVERGGALYVTDANSTPGQRGQVQVTLNDVTFTNNEVTSQGYGGGLFLHDGTLTVNNGTFSGNRADWDGGAISTRSPYVSPTSNPGVTPNGNNSNPAGAGKLVINDSVFEKNTATEYSGGAIGLYTEAEISNTRFSENNAGGHVPTDKTDGGGAIYMGGWAQATLTGTSFEKNSSNRGGAIGTSDAGIASAAKFNISDSSFTGNTATKEGGAVFNKFATANNVISNSTFTGNTAGLFGGAIYNKGTLTVGGVFSQNQAVTGGGAIYNEGTLNIADGSRFSGNISTANDGGAIYSGNYAGNKPQDPAVFAPITTVIGKNVVFENNEARTPSATVGGGAVSNLAKSTMSIGENARFIGNKAPTQGGAIANTLYNVTKYDAAYRPQLTVADGAVFQNNTAMVGGAAANESGVIVFKNNTLFENNSAFTGTNAGRGGALANRAYDGLTAEITLGDNTVFRGNTSANKGGAVYNYSDSTADKAVISFGSGTLFENNTAADNGGAVYNEGVINFNGNSTFTGNTAAGTANDIYNAGTLNFNSGAAKLSGGITGAGNINVANAAILDIGLSTVQASAINFANGSTLAVTLGANGMGYLDSGDISIGQSATDGAKLLVALSTDFLTDASGVTKQLTSSAVKNGSFGLADVKNALYTLSFDDTTNTLTAIRKSQEEQNDEIKEAGGNANNMNAINAFTSSSDLGSSSANQAAQIINNLAQTDLPSAVKATTALASETAASKHSVQGAVTQQVFSAVGSHLTDVSAQAPSAYALGKEDMSYMASDQNYSVWTQGLLNKSHKEETSGASAFTGRSTGLAAGADLKINDDWLAGLGYAFAHSNVDSLQRHSRILGDNFFAYGQYRPGQFFIQGAFNYGDSKYEEEKYLPGMQVNADYHVKTYAANAAMGYDLNDWFTPLLTVRYMNLQQEGYRDSSDQSVSAEKSDFLTGVVGAKAAAEYRVSSSVRIKPQINAGLAYDFLSDNASGHIVLPNGASYDVSGERLHRLSFEAGVSVSALVSDSVEVLLGYDGSFRKEYNSNTGVLKLRYMF